MNNSSENDFNFFEDAVNGLIPTSPILTLALDIERKQKAGKKEDDPELKEEIDELNILAKERLTEMLNAKPSK